MIEKSACAELFLDGFDVALQRRITGSQFVANLVVTTDNCGMVAVSKENSDGFIGSIRDFTAQIHDNLPRNNDFGIPFSTDNIAGGNTIMFGYHIQDNLRRYFPFAVGGNNIF